MERPWQLRKGAVPWNSLLANNLTNQAKVTLAVVMLTGAPCLGDQGKCHKIPQPWEKNENVFTESERGKKRRTVFSGSCNVEGAANILDAHKPAVGNSSLSFWSGKWSWFLIPQSVWRMWDIFNENLTAWCLWQMKSESWVDFEISAVCTLAKE